MSAATMAAATAVEATASAAGEAAACSASDSAASASCYSTAISRDCSTAITGHSAAAISCCVAASISVATAKSATAVEAPAIPGTCADEETAREPARPVVAVGRASVGVISVIAPVTNRGTIDIGGVADRGADSDSHRNLGTCRCRQGQGQNQRNQNRVDFPHFILLDAAPVRLDPVWGLELTSSFSTCRSFGVDLPSGVHLLEQQSPRIVAVIETRMVHILGRSKVEVGG